MSSSSPDVRLQFFLSPEGSLAGAHTVGLADSAGHELLLPLAADPTHPEFRLTVAEAHDLLTAWSQEEPQADQPAMREVPLAADDAVLHVLLAAPTAASEHPGLDPALESVVRRAEWSVTPGPSPRPLPEGRADEMAAAVNGLRLAARLAPLPESDLDFSTDAAFSVATPMVEALAGAVRSMDAAQLAAWHISWMEVVESGYRGDIALASCDALARRTGRGDAWDALLPYADEVAKDVLGADGPSELLMETCAQLFEQIGVDDDETRHLLLGRIAVMLHEQVRVLLLSALVEDVAPGELTVPPLQAWWAGLTLDLAQD